MRPMAIVGVVFIVLGLVADVPSSTEGWRS